VIQPKRRFSHQTNFFQKYLATWRTKFQRFTNNKAETRKPKAQIMEPSETKHGQFSWNELITTDPTAATSFYTKLFGWTTQEFPMPDFTYTVISAGGVGSGQGGIMPTPPAAKGMPPAWIGYVTVDHIDTTAQQVEKLGGKIVVPPRDIPEVGRFAVIQDPQGATLAIITYVKKE
jgi:predicted enzyme related to lactoylglutathione lyase